MKNISQPFSSVWGKVTEVKQDQKSGHVLVTIAGQVLRFQSSSKSGAGNLGLLRLTKRNESVFLIFGEDRNDGIDFIIAGWKNPENRTVLELQPLVISLEFQDLKLAICGREPSWKSWKDSPLGSEKQ